MPVIHGDTASANDCDSSIAAGCRHPVQAQIRARRYPSISRPTVSPYLNLLRRDNNNRGFSALEYYTLVRPEREFRARLDAQASGLDRLRGDVDASTNRSRTRTCGRPGTRLTS